MSDPVSNSDIEDVLSSIRRLVSEEPVAVRRATQQQEATVERFVLTPALRVGEGEDPQDEEELHQEADTVDEDKRVASKEEEDVADGNDADDRDETDELTEDLYEPLGHADAKPSEQFIHLKQRDHVEPEPQQEHPADAEQPVAAEHVDQQVHVLTDAAANHSPEPQIPEAFESVGEWSETSAPGARKPTQGEPPEQAEVASDIQSDPSTPSQDQSLESRIAELEAAVEQTPEEWEPDGSEDEQTDETRPLSADAEDSDESLSDVLGTHVEQTAPEPDEHVDRLDAQTQQEPSEPAETVTEEPASGPEVAQSEGQAQPDNSDKDSAASDDLARADMQDDADETMPDIGAFFHKNLEDAEQPEKPEATSAEPVDEPPEQEQTEDLNEILEFDTPDAAAPAADEWEDVEPETNADAEAEASETDHAELEEPELEALRGWESAPIQDALTEDPSALKDAHDAELVRAHWAAQEELQPEANFEDDADEPVEDADNMLADDEAMLDEDTLREMVSEIVRQELQGVLGERITRNVRRLVRREIQRALTMRDLE